MKTQLTTLDNANRTCAMTEPVSGWHPVKHLIHSIKSDEYFCDGKWTPDPNLAQDFPTLRAAVEAEFQHHLKGVELVLQFPPDPSGTYDIHLPLSGS
jgi:hypothetical protein